MFKCTVKASVYVQPLSKIRFVGHLEKEAKESVPEEHQI